MTEESTIEDLLKTLGNQLDDLPPPRPASQSNNQVVRDSCSMEEKSLEDLMKDVTDKLDELPPPKPASQSMEGSFKDAALPGLENLLNRVAENLEDKTNRSSNNTKKDVSIDMATAEGNDSLENMLRTLNTNIKTTDWLTQNTADKWVQENPQLAEDYKSAAQSHNNS